jgi:5,5'-dehydrodivanillate O-demethylase
MVRQDNGVYTDGSARARHTDFFHTGPDTLAGEYMRKFWQPVYHSDDLPVGHAKPVRIMGVDYTLYRGETGEPHLVDARCAHRGMTLSPGWVQGDTIRCFYHGWVYDGTGQCVEQPAEPQPFCDKIRIGGYPVQDYLGLVFAHLGSRIGEGPPPPPIPRYPTFDSIDGVLEMDSYFRGCNYFNNLENSVDSSHVGFVHRGGAGAWDGATEGPIIIDPTATGWGFTSTVRRPGGQVNVAQFGMPNIFHAKALPVEPEVLGFREFLVWWTPIDDESHIQFTVNAVRLPADKAGDYLARRAASKAKRTIPKEQLAADILAGKIHIDDVDRTTTDMIRLQDDVAQMGQGIIADHTRERLGRTDAGVIMIRQLWTRELRALDEGQPLTDWHYDVEELMLLRAGE